jgi:hypothetical protein
VYFGGGIGAGPTRPLDLREGPCDFRLRRLRRAACTPLPAGRGGDPEPRHSHWAVMIS